MAGSGGKLSSDSATVTALAVAVGLQEGISGPTYICCCIGIGMCFHIALDCTKLTIRLGRALPHLMVLVMSDASGVRLHAGRHAELLNQIVCKLPPEHPLSNARPLRDSLGDTPLQVLAGAVLGCVVAFDVRNSD